MSANLRVAVALALGVSPQRTDAQLIAEINRLREKANGRVQLASLIGEVGAYCDVAERLAARTLDDDPLVVLGAALTVAATPLSRDAAVHGPGDSRRQRRRVALPVATLRRIRDEFARARRAGWIPEPRPSENPYAPPDGAAFAELITALVHCETASEIEHLRGGRDWANEHEALAALRFAELKHTTQEATA